MKRLKFILRDPSTNWKYLFIVIILAFLVGGGILIYYYFELSKQKIEFREIQSPLEKKFVEIPVKELKKEKNKIRILEEIIPFKIDTQEVFYEGIYGGNIKGEKKEEHYEYEGNRFEIITLPIGVSKYGHFWFDNILEALDPEKKEYKSVFEFDNSSDDLNYKPEVYGYKNNLIILNLESIERLGCCITDITDEVFIYDFLSGKSDSKKITATYFIDFPVEDCQTISFLSWREYFLILINNRLYLGAQNEYYDLGSNGPGVGKCPPYGIGVDRYYLLENGEIRERKEDFKGVYTKNALEYAKTLREKTWKGNDWLSPLLGRTLNYIFAGEEEKAWEEFFEDFAEFSENYPFEGIEKIDPQKIKTKIEQELREKE